MKKSRYRLFAIALLAGVATGAQARPAPLPAAAMVRQPGGIEARLGEVALRVTALTDTIIRVRIARDGTFPEDASWAVPQAVRATSAKVTPAVDGFRTGALIVHVDPATLALRITDLAGKVITADAAQPLALDGKAFTLRKALPIGEHIFGLGDKTGGTLDRRGKAYIDWNTDAYGFDSSTDPIYKSIPFFIGVGGAGGSYGILLDNTWRTWFDFGHRTADTLAMGGPDGPIDYYVIAGPTTRDVVRRYTDLTGKAPLPPEWALGYQQSRYSYMTADETRQIADTLRKDRIPTDVIWLDIDFQDRNRPFTVNKQAFPDLKGLVDDLDAQGIKLVTIADLHSRLYWALVDPGLVESASCGTDQNEGSGITVTSFSCDPEQAAGNLDIVRKLLDEVQRDGITAEELAQAKNKITSRVVRHSERPMGRMRAIASSWIYCNEYSDVDRELSRFDAVSLDTIREYLKRYPINQITAVGYGPLAELKK